MSENDQIIWIGDTFSMTKYIEKTSTSMKNGVIKLLSQVMLCHSFNIYSTPLDNSCEEFNTVFITHI